MKNIIHSIMKKISKHKRASVVLLLFLLIGGTVGYVLTTNIATNNGSKVTQTNNQNKNHDTNATGSKDDKKSDEKKNDNKKNEDKKEEVTSETKTEETTNNSTSNTTSVDEDTKNNNASNNTSNTSVQNTPTPCVPTYTTVTHPEVGHYETQIVQEAWDDPQFEGRVVGISSGHIYDSADDFIENGDLYGDGNYAVREVQVGSIHHDAVTTQVWVVDQAAWTETAASGC